MADVMYPSLTRSKLVSINWQGTNLPINNKPYYFAYDMDIKDGLTTGITICENSVYPFDAAYFLSNDTITRDDAKFGYITLVNVKGERIVDSLPLNSLFLGNILANTPGLVTKNFCMEIDPSKSFVVFQYQSGDFSPYMPTGINFEWYYRKKIN